MADEFGPISIEIQGMDRLLEKLEPELWQKRVEDLLRTMTLVVEREARIRAPVDTGRLRGSITSTVQPLLATVTALVDYAAYVEFGTRPHWPPPGALAGWAGRHGIPEFLVARAIALHGTRPQPFMQPAADLLAGQADGIIDEAIAKIEREWQE